MGLIRATSRVAALTAVLYLAPPVHTAFAADPAATPSAAQPGDSTPVPATRVDAQRRRTRRPAELPRRSKLLLGDELPDDSDLPWREALIATIVAYLLYRRLRR